MERLFQATERLLNFWANSANYIPLQSKFITPFFPPLLVPAVFCIVVLQGGISQKSESINRRGVNWDETGLSHFLS